LSGQNKKKQTVLVTGAAGGIGQSICDVFHQAGHNVIGVDRLAVSDRAYEMLQFDISTLVDGGFEVESFCQRVEEISAGKLDTLVNNAAVQVVKPIEDILPEDWDKTLGTNLLAPFWLIQRFLSHLRKAKGSVVNIASIHSTATKSEFSVYATSKGALVAMTGALSIELAPDVRVNAVVPAATDTPMLRAGFEGNPEGLETLGSYHPIGRIALPSEIATVVKFLASPDASFMTGSVVNVDGGIGRCLHDPVVAR
jgi:NAD(P)-dependent dehydrogenase (short-subunit alcohol dehydrogenase family)